MRCIAVGRNSRERWLFGRMQGDTRRDSYIGYPLPFLWHEGSPRVTVHFPQYTKTSHGYQYSNKISAAQWGPCTELETSISTSKPNPTETEEEGRKTQARTRAQRRKMESVDKLSKRYFRKSSWICASANRRGTVQETMWYVCEKQGHDQIGH